MVTLDKKIRTRLRALKHVLKDKRTETLLSSLSQEMALDISVMDTQDHLLWGEMNNYTVKHS
ncbi:hypothetical protein, partial [Lutimonas sp.]|uniref:hypothetical protein n=1 Tax=Lutimonas sp. TaxID=1872403 RepID=UPI003D9ADCFA